MTAVQMTSASELAWALCGVLVAVLMKGREADKEAEGSERVTWLVMFATVGFFMGPVSFWLFDRLLQRAEIDGMESRAHKAAFVCITLSTTISWAVLLVTSLTVVS